MPISVLHISQFDARGGSGRSARKIHDGLSALGVRSKMLTAWNDHPSGSVDLIAANRVVRLADRAAGRVLERMSLPSVATPSSFALTRHPWFREADVLQLFNLHGGWFAYTALPRLTRLKPTVWRLSDMWAMTGHCGYSYECERWLTGCGCCPHLDEYPALRRDRSAANWRIKEWVYARTGLTLVAPSAWLADVARRSPLLSRFDLRVI
jgi:hypothetical protein